MKFLQLTVAVILTLAMNAAFACDEGKHTGAKPGFISANASPILLAKDDKSEAKGARSCSATSKDGKKSCAVSCKESEQAHCSNTEHDAECYCK